MSGVDTFFKGLLGNERLVCLELLFKKGICNSEFNCCPSLPLLYFPEARVENLFDLTIHSPNYVL